MSGFTNRGARNLIGQFQGTGMPTNFYAAMVVAANSGTLNAAAAADQGSDVVRITATAHGMTKGNSVTISGTDNYDGNWPIVAVATDTFDIKANYAAETFSTSDTFYEGPGPETNIFSDCPGAEIAGGNGYIAGGESLSLNTTDFPGLGENDATGIADVNIRTITWSAVGGSIPSSGNGAAFLILTDDNATQANREVWAWFDMGGERSVSTGQDLSVQNGEMRLRQPPLVP